MVPDFLSRIEKLCSSWRLKDGRQKINIVFWKKKPLKDIMNDTTLRCYSLTRSFTVQLVCFYECQSKNEALSYHRPRETWWFRWMPRITQTGLSYEVTLLLRILTASFFRYLRVLENRILLIYLDCFRRPL